MRKIAIYGKGGIGKSTTCSNLSVALACKGYKVLQIGCDPKHDSCRTLTGRLIPTVMEQKQQGSVDISTVLVTGYKGVDCIEAGGPKPGVGCAGKGIVDTMELLEDEVFLEHDYDVVLFDVLGDVVCGGFAKPISDGHADEVCVVTSGEFMSLYAANNIVSSICENKYRQVRLSGIILNKRNIANEDEIVSEYCLAIGSKVLVTIPRENNIGFYERKGKTLMEGDPDNQVAIEIEKLADILVELKHTDVVPVPLSFEQLEALYGKYDNQVAKEGSGGTIE